MRRERARFLVQIEDREKIIATQREIIEKARTELTEAETTGESERERSRAIVNRSTRCKASCRDRACSPTSSRHAPAWPIASSISARACRCGSATCAAPSVRCNGCTASCAQVSTVSNKNSDLVGGRANESADAVYAAVAIGDFALARELFELITDPALFFHNIFNVYRVWAMGLYLQERWTELGTLLRTHQYEGALGGAYALAFRALMERDRAALTRALAAIAQKEWQLWQNPKLTRAAGVVSFGAVALARLARRGGIDIKPTAATVPERLCGDFLAPRRPLAAPSQPPR